MSSKKAQFEINETLLVIIIFTILFLIGIIIFHRFMTASIDNIVLENGQIRQVNLLGTFADLPEVKCSSQQQLSNCVDTFKLFSLKNNAKSYFDLFGFKRIKVFVVYPEQTEDIECNAMEFQNPNYPKNCNTWTIYDKQPLNYESLDLIATPISLYYPITNEHKLGLLEIGWYH